MAKEPSVKLDEHDTRLDPGWTVPDPFDDGLSCVCASALVSFWRKDGTSTLNWFDNLARRLWLPGAWDRAYDLAVAALNLNRIARLCTQAVAVAGASYDAYQSGSDPAWQGLMLQISSFMAPLEGDKALSGDKRADVLWRPTVRVTIEDAGELERLSDAALSLRYLWLARLHERNGRWDPAYDWAEARASVLQTGVPWDDDPYVWQPKVTQMLVDAMDAIVIP